MFNSLIVSFNLYHDVDRLLCVLVNVCFGGRNLHYMCTCISLNRTVMYCWATDERAQFHQTRFDSYTDFVNIRANVGLPIELHYNIQRELCFVLIVYLFRLHAVLPVCGRSSDYILNSTTQCNCIALLKPLAKALSFTVLRDGPMRESKKQTHGIRIRKGHILWRICNH